jgi:hypothetical protein
MVRLFFFKTLSQKNIKEIEGFLEMSKGFLEMTYLYLALKALLFISLAYCCVLLDVFLNPAFLSNYALALGVFAK